MRKAWFIILAVAIVALVLAGGYWYFTKPYYKPGMVRDASELRDPLAPPQQSGTDWIVARDIKLHHFSTGQGPDVIFVHGGPGMPPSVPVGGLKALGSAYRVHFYHQRGCGKSTRPIERPAGSTGEKIQQVVRVLGIQEQVADIERIRRILGKEKVILIGHSFGGYLASLYAAEFPEHVAALVLVSPANLFRMPPEPDHDLFTLIERRLSESDRKEFGAFRAQLMDFSATLEKSDSELAELNWRTGDFFVRAAGPGAIPLEMAKAVDAENSGGWGVQGMYFSMGMRYDLRDELKKIKAPALVLHGKRDLIPEAAVRAIAGTIPGAKYEAVDTGHFPFAERPDEFAQIVKAFLREAEPRRTN